MAFIVPEAKRLVNVGDRFGRLEVIGVPFFYGESHRSQHVVCRCRCGSLSSANVGDLKRGKRVSCGCLQRENHIAAVTKHGQSGSSLYSRWRGMIKRCHNRNDPQWDNYGARGIEVCAPWRNSFEVFCEWAILAGFSDGLELDRIDNDGGYSPSNCRFVPHRENLANRRNTIYAEAFGETLPITVWAADQRCVVSLGTLRKRVLAGWRGETAITKPSCRSASREST